MNASLYEKWQFSFTATHTFTVTVTPLSGDLVPLLILLNGSDSEITRATGFFRFAVDDAGSGYAGLGSIAIAVVTGSDVVAASGGFPRTR